MSTKELTKVQAQTLAFLTCYIAQHGYSPTYAEIAKAANVNVNAIGERVAVLIKKGAVTKANGIARSIRPVLPTVAAGRSKPPLVS